MFFVFLFFLISSCCHNGGLAYTWDPDKMHFCIVNGSWGGGGGGGLPLAILQIMQLLMDLPIWQMIFGYTISNYVRLC